MIMQKTITRTVTLNDPINLEEDLSSADDISERLYLFVFFVSTISSDLNCSIFFKSSSSAIEMLFIHEQVHGVFVEEISVESVAFVVMGVVVLVFTFV